MARIIFRVDCLQGGENPPSAEVIDALELSKLALSAYPACVGCSLSKSVLVEPIIYETEPRGRVNRWRFLPAIESAEPQARGVRLRPGGSSDLQCVAKSRCGLSLL